MNILKSFSQKAPPTGLCYKTMEISCSPGTRYVEIHTPDNRVLRQEPFRYQSIEVSFSETGEEQITPCGNPEWHIRYTPVCEGVHSLFAVHDESREPLGSCNVSKGDSHGYIGVSKKDPRYFAYTDGSPFLPLGINLCWPTMLRESDGTEYGRSALWKHDGLRQYDAWMHTLSENGCNLIRIWAGIEFLCPDTENAGEFRYEKFTVLDTLFDLAEKYHIKIKLTLEQFRFFVYSDEAIQDEWTDFVSRS